MTEQEALDLILRGGRRSSVYADEYKKLAKDIGRFRFLELGLFCREQGTKDIREWLTRKGLYKDIERDMRSTEGPVDMNGDIDTISAQILEKYPLAGEPALPDEVLSKLFRRAQDIFDRVVNNDRSEFSSRERDVIAIAIVQYIKRHNSQDDEGSDRQFWPYIYNQFGFKHDYDKSATARVYELLRHAVRGAFLQHNRFFSSEKETQQYYTSLMLHALAPVQSMESLFEILLFFYCNDLEYKYTPEDPIFKALVSCITTRWDKDIAQQKELNVRSDAMASGLKALFRERPEFMRSFCESIVMRIDSLVRGDDMLRPESTLDMLLRGWYSKKEDALREGIAQGRMGRTGAERIVSSAESVRLRYVLQDRRVCVSVPSIRLDHKADSYPAIELYQGKDCIFSEDMDAYGRLSWTTRELLIRLDDTAINYDAPLNIEASITYDGKELVERDAKLHRDLIVFGENGKEVSAQANAKGIYYLFANASAHIETGHTEPEWIDSDGQLMRLYVDDESMVCVNGTELFLSRERQEDIRYYPSVSRVSGLRGYQSGEEIGIYPAPFELDMRLPEGKRSLNYQIILDDKVEPLLKYCPDGSRSFILKMPDEPIVRHTAQIVELATMRKVCQLSYAILPDVTYALESDLIYDDGQPINVRVEYDGCNIVHRGYPAEGSEWMLIAAEHLTYDLEARLPLIRGKLQDRNIFDLPSTIWHARIPETVFVRIDCPAGWDCRLCLGMEAVPQNAADGSYELGNYLKRHEYRSDSEALTLALRNSKGQQDIKALTRIAFREYFTGSPVCLEGDSLMWRPESVYIGGDKDEFRLVVDVPADESPYTYAVGVKNETADKSFGQAFPCGEFPYKVVKKQRSLFGAGADRVLFEGVLTNGAAEQRSVLNKLFYLTKARCWDTNLKKMIILGMPETAGCLCNLQFKGYSEPAGESIEYPEYVGDLYFYDVAKQKWQRFNDRDRRGYEYINPVHAWIISDHMVIITTVTEDGILFDREYCNIVNQTLLLPRAVEQYRILFVDYFEYRKEQE